MDVLTFFALFFGPLLVVVPLRLWYESKHRPIKQAILHHTRYKSRSLQSIYHYLKRKGYRLRGADHVYHIHDLVEAGLLTAESTDYGYRYKKVKK